MESSSDANPLNWDRSAPASPASLLAALSAGRVRRYRGHGASLYDAVEGRLTLNGVLADPETANSKGKRRLSSTAHRYSSRNPRMGPEDVLFNRRNAPVRYVEDDIYWANEDLPEDGRRHLPDSSLLKSVHGYVGRFYEAAAAARLGPRSMVGARIVDQRSMDETALLAFGVLLEETSRGVLRKGGELVFTEASTEPKSVGAALQHTERLSSSMPTQGPQRVGEAPAPEKPRSRKRRKVAKEDTPRNQAS
ncbi:hypothetical protein C8A05DRAFT_34634 [Staphylotrichum tortipilum]|uniref:Uncharacterized protein n=1 Tax=Staphylotrichum tortipilum TaxID=2831512 RepID=A0AAN6MK49_9PEZI|nr:hypothetical protein C8A05DRAFT_34634 [Staphylotrichum longicolle]